MSLCIEGQEILDFTHEITAQPEHCWYPVYCRSNKEKIFFKTFSERGISCYMPEVIRHRTTRGKRYATPVAMFTGYVFVCTTRLQNWAVKQSRHVSRVLPVTKQNEEQLISELNIIRRFEELAATQQVVVLPELVPGQKVMITQGQLQGIEGIVVKRKNAVEIIVRLDFLGCSLSTVEAYDLEPV